MPRKWKTVSGQIARDSRSKILVNPYNMFSGTITLPAPDFDGRYSNHDESTVIFENWASESFHSSDLALDSVCAGVAFETESSIFNTELADFKSLTVRAPDSDNTHTYGIKHNRGRSMEGDVYTYIETPVLINLQLTWKLMKCATPAESLLGCLCYDAIRMVWNDHTYQLRLISDVFSLVNAVRAYKTVTLTFEGIKIA